MTFEGSTAAAEDRDDTIHAERVLLREKRAVSASRCDVDPILYSNDSTLVPAHIIQSLMHQSTDFVVVRLCDRGSLLWA